MCGIVGYVGHRRGVDVAMRGLRRLEYRGYDSAGVAVVDGSGGLAIARRAGRLARLEQALAAQTTSAFAGGTAIGHTRWATHGRPNDVNAHPHTDSTGRIAVVHNGIVENAADLRSVLRRHGSAWHSETDTEVTVHLVSRAYFGPGPTKGDFVGSVLSVVRGLQGAFTLVFVHAEYPDMIVAARRSTPLVVGIGKREVFIGSDVTAFMEYTRDALEFEHDSVVTACADTVTAVDFHGDPIVPRAIVVDWNAAASEKGGYKYFMHKEIAEQPQAVANTLRDHFVGGRVVLDEQRMPNGHLGAVDKIVIVGCGSAYHSGLVAKYAIEHWTRLTVEVEFASEFRYRDAVLNRSTLVVAVSQSGETADTLEAVRLARERGACVLAVCNTNGAQIPRESDAVMYTRAGPEIGVAATKTFLAQVTANYLVGLGIAQARGTRSPAEVADIVAKLNEMPTHIEAALEANDHVQELGRRYAGATEVLFLGRHVGFPVALEGALKLKEIAYMHAEGYAAGELKHGPIALIEEGTPVIVVMPSCKHDRVVHTKLLTNIQEIQARGARTIVIAEQGDDRVAPFADHLVEIPSVTPLLQPLLSTVPLQLFAAAVADARGYDVDKPRNLAKSVTVE